MFSRLFLHTDEQQPSLSTLVSSNLGKRLVSVRSNRAYILVRIRSLGPVGSSYLTGLCANAIASHFPLTSLTEIVNSLTSFSPANSSLDPICFQGFFLLIRPIIHQPSNPPSQLRHLVQTSGSSSTHFIINPWAVCSSTKAGLSCLLHP